MKTETMKNVGGTLIVAIQHCTLGLLTTMKAKIWARKENGNYVHTGDSVGVVTDTAKGEISFVLNGVNFGVAFNSIPLDKPLVPCVLLRHGSDSVELDTTEVKENVNRSIHVPSNITTKNGIT